MRGTLADIDPLSKVPVYESQKRVKNLPRNCIVRLGAGPARGLGVFATCSNGLCNRTAGMVQSVQAEGSGLRVEGLGFRV